MLEFALRTGDWTGCSQPHSRQYFTRRLFSTLQSEILHLTSGAGPNGSPGGAPESSHLEVFFLGCRCSDVMRSRKLS